MSGHGTLQQLGLATPNPVLADTLTVVPSVAIVVGLADTLNKARNGKLSQRYPMLLAGTPRQAGDALHVAAPRERAP